MDKREQHLNSKREQHLNRMRIAEQQFRLACTVNLAVTNDVQTLDVPVEWTFGRHRVSYEDFGLREDQAEDAAMYLERTTTFVVACVVRDALIELFENPKAHANPDVIAAYQISRMIRNAFAHSMVHPRWSIDDDCKDKNFAIQDVISINTTGLNGQPLDWRNYGGPLAIFYFARFVREVLFGDKIDPNRAKPPFPLIECYQQGRLIVRRIDEIRLDSAEVASSVSDETLDLGDGHRLHVSGKAKLFK
jgi:hypothetical protein